MPFTLHVKFSGVLSIVKHPGGAGYRVLVPDTLFGTFANGPFEKRPERMALDGKKKLDRHYPFVRTPLDARQSQSTRCLEHEEVAFDFTFADGAGDPISDQAANLRDVASMPDVWDAGAVDRLAAETPSAHRLVTSHADLLHGSTSTSLYYGWTIPGHARRHGAGADDLDVCLPRIVSWKVPGLTSVTVRTRPYPGSTSEPWSETLDDGEGDHELMFANFPHPPGDSDHHQGPPVRDLDFRWHFELLDPAHREDLRDALATASGAASELPVPDPKPDGDQCRPGEALGEADRKVALFSPSGGNCMAARWF